LTKAREISATPETVISSGTFSAVASLSLSSILTDTYKFYNLYFYAAASTATTINLRLRQDSTDVTTAYWGAGNYGIYSGGTGVWFNCNNATTFGLTSTDVNAISTILMKVVRPDATRGIISYQTYDNYNDAGAHFSGTRDGMTNFNGLTFYPGSGTMTGRYILTGIR
jgi:hypothetical protein